MLLLPDIAQQLNASPELKVSMRQVSLAKPNQGFTTPASGIQSKCARGWLYTVVKVGRYSEIYMGV